MEDRVSYLKGFLACLAGSELPVLKILFDAEVEKRNAQEQAKHVKQAPVLKFISSAGTDVSGRKPAVIPTENTPLPPASSKSLQKKSTPKSAAKASAKASPLQSSQSILINNCDEIYKLNRDFERFLKIIPQHTGISFVYVSDYAAIIVLYQTVKSSDYKAYFNKVKKIYATAELYDGPVQRGQWEPHWQPSPQKMNVAIRIFNDSNIATMTEDDFKSEIKDMLEDVYVTRYMKRVGNEIELVDSPIRLSFAHTYMDAGLIGFRIGCLDHAETALPLIQARFPTACLYHGSVSKGEWEE